MTLAIRCRLFGMYLSDPCMSDKDKDNKTNILIIQKSFNAPREKHCIGAIRGEFVQWWPLGARPAPLAKLSLRARGVKET